MFVSQSWVLDSPYCLIHPKEQPKVDEYVFEDPLLWPLLWHPEQQEPCSACPAVQWHSLVASFRSPKKVFFGCTNWAPERRSRVVGLLGVYPTTVILAGISPFLLGVSRWEALFGVSRKSSFPTALRGYICEVLARYLSLFPVTTISII